MPDLLTIDQAANLNVPLLGEGDDHRFFEVVREWWQRMPAEPKATIVNYWTRDGGRHCRWAWGPLAGLIEDWPDRGPSTPASLRNDRESEKFYIAFCSYYFERTPNEAAVVLLAHEFAHLYQLATGTLYNFPPLSREEAVAHFERVFGDTYERAMTYLQPDTLEGAISEVAHDYSPVEVDANRLVAEWGFNLETLKQWDREVGSRIPPPPQR